jgi:hypothetical protein
MRGYPGAASNFGSSFCFSIIVFIRLTTKKINETFMKENIGVNAANLSKAANVLSGFLADEFLLYLKTRNAHWNIEGSDFHSMHKFF